MSQTRKNIAVNPRRLCRRPATITPGEQRLSECSSEAENVLDGQHQRHPVLYVVLAVRNEAFYRGVRTISAGSCREPGDQSAGGMAPKRACVLYRFSSSVDLQLPRVFACDPPHADARERVEELCINPDGDRKQLIFFLDTISEAAFQVHDR